MITLGFKGLTSSYSTCFNSLWIAVDLLCNCNKSNPQRIETKWSMICWWVVSWDRFMKQHIRDLHEHVRTSSAIKRRAEEWQTVLSRVRNQLPLRVMSCCRIAGQMDTSCQVTTSDGQIQIGYLISVTIESCVLIWFEYRRFGNMWFDWDLISVDVIWFVMWPNHQITNFSNLGQRIIVTLWVLLL